MAEQLERRSLRHQLFACDPEGGKEAVHSVGDITNRPSGWRRCPGQPSAGDKCLGNSTIDARDYGKNQTILAREKCCGDNCDRNACRWRIHYYGTVMPILGIKHVTTYHCEQHSHIRRAPMMLVRTTTTIKRLLNRSSKLRPVRSNLPGRDSFGNHMATAYFGDRACELRFASGILSTMRRTTFAQPI